MRDIAVIAFAQMPNVRRGDRPQRGRDAHAGDPGRPRQRAGLDQQQIGFTCSGSTDYLSGQAFSFVSTLDGVGPWPPIQESHVEMDGAWALYEAWVKLQLGDVDTALVYCYGKSAPGPIHEVLSRQLDPYHVAPLWPDAISLAALQARALIDGGQGGGGGLLRGGGTQPAQRHAQPQRPAGVGQLGARTSSRWSRSWTRCARSDCPPITDGACAVVLAADDRARELCDRPGMDPRDRPPDRTDGPRVCVTSPSRSPPARPVPRRGRQRSIRRRRAARARSARRS